MQTSKWGKPGWETMFYVAAGYELNDLPQHVKGPQYKRFFQSMGSVLPCKYCRDSYVDFFQELDFDEYLTRRCGCIQFVYDMKRKVNEKLRLQEQRALKIEYDKLSSTLSTDDPRFWENMQRIAHKICYTKPDPPLAEVIENLSKCKAQCSANMKTCRDPLVVNEPSRRQSRRRSRV